MKESDLIEDTARELARQGKLDLERSYIQHGTTTVYDHSVHVAYVSLRMVRFTHLKVDTESLIRGALLHDYFLYDWHVYDPNRGLHGFTHPRTALENARKDFTLTKKEENIILRHMFPLTPHPPRYKESWIVCIADKYCAASETIRPHAKQIR